MSNGNLLRLRRPHAGVPAYGPSMENGLSSRGACVLGTWFGQGRAVRSTIYSGSTLINLWSSPGCRRSRDAPFTRRRSKSSCGRLPLQGPQRGRSVRRHQPLSVSSSDLCFCSFFFRELLRGFAPRSVDRRVGLSTLQDRRHQAQQPAGHRHDRLFRPDTGLQPLVDPFPSR